MKFIIMVWLAFLARQRPVSTIAKPACMNITRNPVIRVHTKLMAMRFCPTWLTVSARVNPLLVSETTTSLTVPVFVPLGSPLARSSVEGGCAAFTSRGAFMAGVAAGGAGGALFAGLALCAHAESPHRSSTRTTVHEHRFMPSPILIIPVSLKPSLCSRFARPTNFSHDQRQLYGWDRPAVPANPLP